MRTTIVICSLLFTAVCARSQNVGIRTNSPGFPLTVNTNASGIGIVQKDGIVEMGIVSTDPGRAFLKTLSIHPLHFSTNNSTAPTMTISTAGNVGIGLGSASPTYKLDIEGRVRMQKTEQTAGIWFDGPTLPTRGFIGTLNDYHAGIYGSAGAGWNIVMNVEDGKMGIGTSDPTAKLDVNGSLRIRNSNAKPGSVFVSEDASGNADWLAPVAFRAQGSVDGNSIAIPSAAWTKVFFSTTTAYNLGLHYQPVNSQFVAPVKGIYHFNAQTTWSNNRYSVGIGIDGTRNGSPITNLPQNSFSNGRVPYEGSWYNIFNRNVERIDIEIKLEAGDIIWLKVYRNTGDQLNVDPARTWFTGRLVTLL
jgi:hypothetical protein